MARSEAGISLTGDEKGDWTMHAEKADARQYKPAYITIEERADLRKQISEP